MVYTPSEKLDVHGRSPGIRLRLSNTSVPLNSSSGVITWREILPLVPATHGVHPQLPIAGVDCAGWQCPGGQARLFFWDHDRIHIRQAHWNLDKWAEVSDFRWEVSAGPGRGMDAIVWLDPLHGLRWSCFYTDANGHLFELTLFTEAGEWINNEVAVIDPNTQISASVRWSEGMGHNSWRGLTI